MANAAPAQLSSHPVWLDIDKLLDAKMDFDYTTNGATVTVLPFVDCAAAPLEWSEWLATVKVAVERLLRRADPFYGRCECDCHHGGECGDCDCWAMADEAEADAAVLAEALRDLTVKYARNGWHYKDADEALNAHDARLRRGQEQEASE